MIYMNSFKTIPFKRELKIFLLIMFIMPIFPGRIPTVVTAYHMMLWTYDVGPGHYWRGGELDWYFSTPAKPSDSNNWLRLRLGIPAAATTIDTQLYSLKSLTRIEPNHLLFNFICSSIIAMLVTITRLCMHIFGKPLQQK